MFKLHFAETQVPLYFYRIYIYDIIKTISQNAVTLINCGL